jgi:hypothetical protein
MMTDFAETAEISGKTIADSSNMINYVKAHQKREKSANFGRREEM